MKLKRYTKLGVGKKIGSCLYLHRKYVPTEYLRPIPESFLWNILKYDFRTKNISFIYSPDFDSADEPQVGLSLVVKPNGKIKKIPPSKDPWIYHHKWLMVKEDYTGFDVQESKERSEKWTSLNGIDYSRIGKKSFWDSLNIQKFLNIPSKNGAT